MGKVPNSTVFLLKHYYSLTSKGQAVCFSQPLGIQGSREGRDTQDHIGIRPEVALCMG